MIDIMGTIVATSFIIAVGFLLPWAVSAWWYNRQ